MYHLIEKGLGWEHNVQFVCLAFQNAMTTQISGQQSIQCRSLDEIIVNEVPQGKQGKEGHCIVEAYSVQSMHICRRQARLASAAQ